MDKHNIYAYIKAINEIPFQDLRIPIYQRPYVWSRENVRQLLDDILCNQNKSEYRIGSIILHKENDILNIVDGQQRLTTIVLLSMCLQQRIDNQLSYHHQTSYFHIQQNESYIREWITQNLKSPTLQDSFYAFLMDKCKFTWIVVDDISEAFQMFDTQNGRGKPLEAYNLLKAYHLRAIDRSNTTVVVTDSKRDLDIRWESAARYSYQQQNIDLLKRIVSYLYKTRARSRYEYVEHFDGSKIGEFKGIQIDYDKTEENVPCQNMALWMFQMLSSSNQLQSLTPSKRYDSETISGIQPYMTINMPIINGQFFFDYIDTYVRLYEYLFLHEFKDGEKLYNFWLDYQEYCCQYDGASRVGDSNLRVLYETICLAVFDRFGEEGIVRYYHNIYNLVYRLRLYYEQVRYATVSQYPLSIFVEISKANSLADLQVLSDMASEKIICRMVNRCERVLKYIVSHSNCPIVASGNIIVNDKELKDNELITIDLWKQI